MVKKVTKKATQQRAAKPKEEIQVIIKQKLLGKAPEEKSFVLHDGRKLRTVYELIDELERMTDEQFREYVDGFRNDFANWIRDVFEAPSLAEEIAKTSHRIEAQRAILKELVRELKKLAPKE